VEVTVSKGYRHVYVPFGAVLRHSCVPRTEWMPHVFLAARILLFLHLNQSSSFQWARVSL